MIYRRSYKSVLNIAVIFAAFLLVIGSNASYAHVSSAEASSSVADYDVSLIFSPKDIAAGENVKLDVHVFKDGESVGGLNITLGVHRMVDGKEVPKASIVAREVEPGQYEAYHEFDEPGQYINHVSFMADGKEVSAEFSKMVEKNSPSPVFWSFNGLVLAGVFVSLLYEKAKLGKKNVADKQN